MNGISSAGEGYGCRARRVGVTCGPSADLMSPQLLSQATELLRCFWDVAHIWVPRAHLPNSLIPVPLHFKNLTGLQQKTACHETDVAFYLEAWVFLLPAMWMCLFRKKVQVNEDIRFANKRSHFIHGLVQFWGVRMVSCVWSDCAYIPKSVLKATCHTIAFEKLRVWLLARVIPVKDKLPNVNQWPRF